MSNMAEAGEALGELIGVKMATVCPDLLMEMVNRVRTNDEAPEETDEKTLTGVITKVEQEGFVTFSIKDESGKTSKLYWMELVTSGIDLVNMFPQMTGRTVDVTYVTREFFDPRIGEYRVFLVIKSLEWSTR
ncbi:MAG: hypothetical protein SF053_05700 [Bacteroidia bacterium]|nr:hypothetical protein [Bacteroidia bacterium]